MKKTFAFILATCIISLTSFAQNAKDKIERQARDPKTSENAAKADQYVVDKKKIYDSTSNKRSGSPKESAVKHNRKKNRSCNDK